MKTIGLLTSGGDAPGMNACIRAIVRTCVYNGIRVMGIRFGFDGLIRGDIYEMNVSSVADIIQREVRFSVVQEAKISGRKKDKRKL